MASPGASTGYARRTTLLGAVLLVGCTPFEGLTINPYDPNNPPAPDARDAARKMNTETGVVAIVKSVLANTR